MSKKYKKPRRRQNFPWPLIAFGGILLTAAALLFANQSNGDSGGTPAIAVDQQRIDYGDVKFNTNLYSISSR